MRATSAGAIVRGNHHLHHRFLTGLLSFAYGAYYQYIIASTCRAMGPWWTGAADEMGLLDGGNCEPWLSHSGHMISNGSCFNAFLCAAVFLLYVCG